MEVKELSNIKLIESCLEIADKRVLKDEFNALVEICERLERYDVKCQMISGDIGKLMGDIPIKLAEQHKRTRYAAIDLATAVLGEFIDTSEYTKDGLLGSVFVIERMETLIKNIQNLPQ